MNFLCFSLQRVIGNNTRVLFWYCFFVCTTFLDSENSYLKKIESFIISISFLCSCWNSEITEHLISYLASSFTRSDYSIDGNWIVASFSGSMFSCKNCVHVALAPQSSISKQHDQNVTINTKVLDQNYFNRKIFRDFIFSYPKKRRMKSLAF